MTFARWRRQAPRRTINRSNRESRRHQLAAVYLNRILEWRPQSALRSLAHAGATGVEWMSVNGHSSLDQAQEYIDEVYQEHAADAAMTKPANRSRTASD